MTGLNDFRGEPDEYSKQKWADDAAALRASTPTGAPVPSALAAAPTTPSHDECDLFDDALVTYAAAHRVWNDAVDSRDHEAADRAGDALVIARGAVHAIIEAWVAAARRAGALQMREQAQETCRYNAEAWDRNLEEFRSGPMDAARAACAREYAMRRDTWQQAVIDMGAIPLPGDPAR